MNKNITTNDFLDRIKKIKQSKEDEYQELCEIVATFDTSDNNWGNLNESQISIIHLRNVTENIIDQLDDFLSMFEFYLNSIVEDTEENK